MCQMQLRPPLYGRTQLLSYFIETAPWGHTLTHFPQPMHLSASTTGTSALKRDVFWVMACTGHTRFDAQKGE